MSSLERLSARMAAPDAVQYFGLYLVVILFALLAAWPGDPQTANDSWFAVAHTRSIALSLLALGFGTALAGHERAQQRNTALMLVCFALLTLPLEVAAYAASYPATPLYWPLLLSPLWALATFGLGLLHGTTLGMVRLRLLAPVTVPALLAALIYGGASGFHAISPLASAAAVSWSHLALVAGGALVTAAGLAWPGKTGVAAP